MKNKFIFYLCAFILLLASCLSFNNAYRNMVNYSNLTNKTFSDYNHFLILSQQINNAAVINPDMVVKGSSFKGFQEFFTDSQTVMRELNTLQSAAPDSVNNQIIPELSSSIKAELNWMLNSNVPDSIVNHKALEHLSSLQRIDSLIKAGIKRNVLLLENNKEKLEKAIIAMNIQMIIFIVIAGFFLLYTVISFSRQTAKTEKRFTAMVENSDAIIILLDEQYRIIYKSVSVDRVLGWLPGEKPFERGNGNANHRFSQEINNILSKAMASPGQVIPVKFPAPGKNGEPVWLGGSFQNLLADDNVNAIVINCKDVTRETRSEDALIKSEEHYRLLFEQATDAIYIADATLRYIDINPAGCRMLGYSKEEFLQLSPTDLVFPEDAATFAIKLEEIKSGKYISYERKMRRKDGMAVEVEANGRLQEGGRFIIIARDTTDRKKLEAQQVLFASIVNSSDDAILTTSLDGVITSWNQGAEKIFGYTSNEIIGESIMKLIPVHLQHQEAEILTQIRDGLLVHHFQTHRIKKNGDLISVSLSVSPVKDFSGNITGISKIARDITERIKAEEKLIRSEQIYRTIASNIPGSVICLLDINFRYYLIEGDILEKLGYSKEMLLGNQMKDIVEPGNYEVVSAQFEQAKRGEIVSRESIINGFDMMTRIIPLKDENNEVYSIMTVTIEITKIKEAQRRISELNENLEQKVAERTMQLENVNKELQQFAYIASHDLQQPLRTVSNYMEIFEEDYMHLLDERARNYLNSVNTAIKRMSNLILALLEFSKLSANKKLDVIDCNILVAEVLADLGLIIKDSKARITAGSMPQLNAYQIELRQLFQNLILNAIKFQDPGNIPEIEILSGFINNKWQFSIKDNGIGIDPKYFDRIFNIFQRLDVYNKYQGSGIGLANCKKIVELHKGEIWLESVKGGGATFYFTIPILII